MSEVNKKKLAVERAIELTAGDRRESYGDAYSDFSGTALMWSGILGISVTAKQVALCMVALKLRREAYKHKQDNLDDAVGYIHLIDKDPRFNESRQ